MFYRDPPTMTLDDVREQLDDGAETVIVNNSQVALDLTGDGAVAFGEGSRYTVPATTETLGALGSWLDVPGKFLERIDPDDQQYILSSLLRKQPGSMLIRFTDAGIVEVRDPGTRVIDTRRLVDVAGQVIDNAAPVVDFWQTGKEFRLDVMVPEGFDRGWGGEAPTTTGVGDLTGGGIRIGQDRAHNLAPWVSTLLYRLACTNGMEMLDEGLRIDARGQTVDQVMAEFHDAADRAFRRVEADIAGFYNLRNEQVDNPERTLIRMASEQGLPDRTIMALAEAVPAYTDDDGHATMFDLVNLITNRANDPAIRNRANVRRTLEVTGGNIVTTHAERCAHCQSKLV